MYQYKLGEKASCPRCKSNVYLLFHDSPSNLPSFYICFDCKYIGEIGVGEVKCCEEQ